MSISAMLIILVNLGCTRIRVESLVQHLLTCSDEFKRRLSSFCATFAKKVRNVNRKNANDARTIRFVRRDGTTACDYSE
jgi:hypothetical protein